jgi:phospholipase C
MSRLAKGSLAACAALCASTLTCAARADGDLHKLQHVIIVMQENHSFDNYFGALAYAPGSPYHVPDRDRDADRNADRDRSRDRDDRAGCAADDHDCVDGLSCIAEDRAGNFLCFNSNEDDDGSRVRAFHDTRRCVAPDLDHGWVATHEEANFRDPNDSLAHPRNDGFVRVNDQTEQLDNGVESPTDDQTMNFYDQDELPFYYDLAAKFAIDDRYFCSVLGPTFPNRSYLLAATSFGHLTTNDDFPPPGGYHPITGTIFDLLDQNQVTWADYFSDVPQGGSFRQFSLTAADPHFLPVALFLAQAAGVPAAGPLPQVSFVDPNFGVLQRQAENDEHPPTDIQRGQAFVSQIVNTVRNGPHWSDSIVFITYDEHGGSYDHVKPPPAPQGGARTPDDIEPGQCADLSNPPASLQPGGGAFCSNNLLSATGTSVNTAANLCPAFAADPTGPFPASCATFDQLGFRVPFIAVSPFSKRHYVSHTIGDHTSMLALIEKRFMSKGTGGSRQHLTRRDEHASTLEDLFDFDRSPSLATAVTQALPPAADCSPTGVTGPATP